MIFIHSDRFNLTVEEPDVFTDLLNEQHTGSQLGRLPLSKPKDNDKNNLILAIKVNLGNKDKRIIGRVSLENIDYINQTAELKIFIAKEFQGKGYAKEACELVIQHGFNELNLNRVYAGTLSNNIGFQKLAEHLKLEEEGIRKEAVYKSGMFYDIIEYGRLRLKNA